MKRKTIFTLVVIVIVFTIGFMACSPYDSPRDFIVEEMADGSSVEITGYTGGKETVRIPPTIVLFHAEAAAKGII